MISHIGRCCRIQDENAHNQSWAIPKIDISRINVIFPIVVLLLVVVVESTAQLRNYTSTRTTRGYVNE
jgi:hypothetical protein